MIGGGDTMWFWWSSAAMPLEELGGDSLFLADNRSPGNAKKKHN